MTIRYVRGSPRPVPFPRGPYPKEALGLAPPLPPSTALYHPIGMPISYLTRIVEFTASHRIRRADWPPERSTTEFGKAAVDHSHRYQCRVTVKGRLAREAGGVMSLKVLDALLEEEIVRPLDGKSINDALPEFADGK